MEVIGYIAIVLAIILFSMMLHEIMHGLTAYVLGDDTAKLMGRLSLNPLRHIDPFMTILLPVILALSGLPIFGGAKPVPFNSNRIRYDEWGVALVAIAGPLTNLLLAFVAFGIYAVLGVGVNSTAGSILMLFVSINLGFFAFNILPIPPLDGSRVLYALAPNFVRRAMEFIEGAGITLIFVIVLLASQAIGVLMSTIIGKIIWLFSVIFGVN
ncbi:zinc metalloprotease ywhC [Candidatus Saccharibacteria bacterium]|nr:MAG: zinc metalloprotease ywhC [Candidatus Saccharibacteria bacterium]